LINEDGSSGDATAADAYKFAGVTYAFYKAKFGRDSFDASGAALHSSVHFGPPGRAHGGGGRRPYRGGRACGHLESR